MAAVAGVKDIFQKLEELQAAEAKAGVSDAINEPNQESEVIVVGAKGSGKSSLIHAFVNKADPPKPTTALEYKYARYSSKEGSKVIIANIWELAGDTQLAQLLDVVLTPAKLARSQVVIVADLSKPSEVLRTVNYWLNAVRARVDACTREMRRHEAGQAALKQLESRVHAAGPPEMRPVGVPVLLVGSKFDLFEEASQASTEFLQVMSRTLRYVAHANGASLVYTRDKDKALLGAMRRIISQHAFEQEALGSFQGEYTRGIVVPVGRDTLQQIGAPPGLEGVTDRERLNDAWGRTFQALFPSSAEQQRAEGREKKKHVVDSDQYAEEAVDVLRAQKLKELTQRAARIKAEAAAEAAATAAQAGPGQGASLLR